MYWSTIISVLILIINSFTIRAQSHDCRRIRERCVPCIRNLTDPVNNLDPINWDCRGRIGRRWIWRDVRRCDMQIIACENHDKRLDCETVAILMGMTRRPN